jgi:hypothetical protein
MCVRILSALNIAPEHTPADESTPEIEER